MLSSVRESRRNGFSLTVTRARRRLPAFTELRPLSILSFSPRDEFRTMHDAARLLGRIVLCALLGVLLPTAIVPAGRLQAQTSQSQFFQRERFLEEDIRRRLDADIPTE